MEPNTVITIGMIATLFTTVGIAINFSIKAFQIYQAIESRLLQLQIQLQHLESSSPFVSFGAILERVTKLENDLNAVPSKARNGDVSLRRHIESHCLQISHIGEFLEEKLDYRPTLKSKLSEGNE